MSDGMSVVELFQLRGGSIHWLAAQCSVHVSVIEHWLRHGVPAPVLGWNKPGANPIQVDQYRCMLQHAWEWISTHPRIDPQA